MSDNELPSQSAAQMAEMVRAKTISPVELIDAHLARIEELQPALNAFVTIDWNCAREQAKAAEAGHGASSPGFRVAQGSPS